MKKMKSDVAVIGAGPAGSATALMIAKCGFDVVLIERDKYPGMTNVCAGATPKSIIKDMGLSPDIIEKEIRIEKHNFPWGVKTDSVNHISVYRHVFDRHLADKAVEDGAKLFTSTLIKDISIKNDGVYLSGKDAAFESKIVVFADGPNTLAYKKFGIGFRPDSDKTAISAVCEVEWKDNPLNQLEYYYGMDISPWGYGWTFPKRDTINVGVGCLYSKIRSNVAESLNFLLRKHPLTKEMFRDKKILGYSSATIPNAPAKRIFGERMLVVGDAAGMVDCVTGGGIGPAIIGGKIAGKTCADALEYEDFSGMFLSRYQNSWQNTGIYTHIYSKYLLTNAFLYFYKFDKNAFVKLTAITQGGISNLPRTLKLLLWRKT